MPSRFVGPDRPRRISWSKPGGTVIIVNQDNVSDIYISESEDELLSTPYNSSGVPQLNNASIGTKIAANGGQLNWVGFSGAVFAIASGGVGANGSLSTFVRVTPG